MDPLFWWGVVFSVPAILFGLALAVRTAMNNPKKFVDVLIQVGIGLFFLASALGIAMIVVGLIATFDPKS